MGVQPAGAPSSEDGGWTSGAGQRGNRYSANMNTLTPPNPQYSTTNGARPQGFQNSAGLDGPYDSDNPPLSEGRPSRSIEYGQDQASTPRERSRNNGGGAKSSSGTLRMCKKCGEPLTGQFVRALGGTFHLDCFKCAVSNPFQVQATLILTQPCRIAVK